MAWRQLTEAQWDRVRVVLPPVKPSRKGADPGRTIGGASRLIANRGYDSNGLRQKLKRRGIQPIITALRNLPNATDQDGRCLRRYRRRWIVERTIGWLGNFRRLTVRYDRLLATYGGFFHLACALLVLRRVVK